MVVSREICKFLRTTFLTEQLQWLLLRFNSCFQRNPEQKAHATVEGLLPPNCYQTHLVPKFGLQSSWITGACHYTRKIQKQPQQVFFKRRLATLLKKGSSIAKFLRTPILKSICERLLLKISSLAISLPKEGNCWIFLSF